MTSEAPAPSPDPALRLLWRHHLPEKPEVPRRGPRQKVTLDEVIDAAIGLADREGLAAVTMRSLAKSLGMGAMSLYTYLPGRPELITLMVDQVLSRRELPALPDDLRARMALVARVERDGCRAHPWMLDVTGLRPWLGPGASVQYEWQLAALDGIGLTDLEMDQSVALLSGYAANVVRAEHEKLKAERGTGQSELEWWEANYEELGRVMTGSDFPIAARVGQAAGEAYQAATDPAREFEFGLERILDGLLAYLKR